MILEALCLGFPKSVRTNRQRVGASTQTATEELTAADGRRASDAGRSPPARARLP